MIVFPDPNVETEYTDPNGSVWEFNGTGWVRQCDCSDGGDGGGGGGVDDPEWGSTVLLLDGDTGPNGANNNYFRDSSTYAHPIIVNGKVVQGSFSPYGTKSDSPHDIKTDGGSAYFDGSGDRLDFTPSFSLGSNDFTIEMWIKPEGLISSSALDTFFWLESGTNDFIAIRIDNSGNEGLELRVFKGGTQVLLSQGSDYINANEWIHLAATKNGSTYNFFINGKSVGAATYATPLTSYTGGHIGGWSSVTQDYRGYISNVRIVNGSALYTSDFTPPTSPLTAVANTGLLLNFQDAGIYDRTGTKNLATVGNAQIDTSDKKYGTGSIKFDGAGDYLAVGSGEEIAMGAGDFTIEGWVSIRGGTNTEEGVFHISNAHLPSNQHGPCLLRSNGEWYIYYGQGTSQRGSGKLEVLANRWYHFAYVRNSGTINLYIDGTSVISVADTTNYTGQHLMIGGYFSSVYLLHGSVDDFRITKGVARYTTDFTPPPMLLPNAKALLAEREKQMALTRGEVIDETPDPKYVPYIPSEVPTAMPSPIMDNDVAGNEIDFDNDVTTEE